MKVKAIRRYSDILLKKIVEKDTVFEVEEERGKHLKRQGMVEILSRTAVQKKESAAES